MKPIRHLVLAFLALAIFLVALPAFAQAAPAVLAVAPALSTGAIIVLGLTFLLGATTQAQSTGKLFGQIALPAAAHVTLAIVVPFLAASVQYLTTVAFSGAACVYAAFAGLAAVTSSTAGALAVHAHVSLPSNERALRAAAGKLIVGVALLVGLSTVASSTACQPLTPAQVATLNADAQLAANILQSLQPVACGIIDATDPANATAVCEIITDVATGATALVPITGSLAALAQVVATKPANAAVTSAVTTTKRALAARRAPACHARAAAADRLARARLGGASVSGRIVNGLHVGGRLAPPKAHHLHLAAARYGINLAAFPATPAATAYSDAPSAQPTLRNICLNNKKGTCTIADLFHRQGIRQAMGGRPVYNPTDDVVEATYVAADGDPGDNGCDETVVQGNACSGGTVAGDGILDKPAGFIQIDPTNRPLVRAALTMFGPLSACAGLPDDFVNNMPSGDGYTFGVTGPANPENGHCYTLGDQTDGESFIIWTWAFRGGYTYDACAEYNAATNGGALYATIDVDILASSIQKAPDGLDWKSLAEDFQDIGGVLQGATGPSLLERLEAAIGRHL